MAGRTIKWFEDDGDVIVVERTNCGGHWDEQRVVLTRKEIAKLAKAFPVALEEKKS